MDVLSRFIELKNTPEIDFQKMQQWRDVGSTLGQSDITEKIKLTYRANTVPALENMRRSLNRNDTAFLCRQFERMKVGCGTVGFLRLQRMCEYSEDLVLHHGCAPENLEIICRTIEVEFLRTLVLLESL